MIKSFLIGSLTILSLFDVTTIPAKAQQIESYQSNLTPRQLISLARQGRFKAQGIPGYSNFGSAVRSGKVDAEKLIASAVAQNKLPKTALQNESYLSAVENHLKSGGCSSS